MSSRQTELCGAVTWSCELSAVSLNEKSGELTPYRSRLSYLLKCIFFHSLLYSWPAVVWIVCFLNVDMKLARNSQAHDSVFLQTLIHRGLLQDVHVHNYTRKQKDETTRKNNLSTLKCLSSLEDQKSRTFRPAIHLS